MAANATPPRWTDADTAELKALHGKGQSLHSIAKEMGRSKDTISRYAAKAGLSWDRTRTANAAAAKAIDAKDRRAALQIGLLEDAARLREQLWAETAYATAVGGQEPQVMRWKMARPIPADQLKIMQAVGAAIDRSLKLADHDAGAGAEAVLSLLGGIATQLGVHPTQPQEPEATP